MKIKTKVLLIYAVIELIVGFIVFCAIYGVVKFIEELK
jgi:hypothetical protein